LCLIFFFFFFLNVFTRIQARIPGEERLAGMPETRQCKSQAYSAVSEFCSATDGQIDVHQWTDSNPLKTRESASEKKLKRTRLFSFLSEHKQLVGMTHTRMLPCQQLCVYADVISVL